MEFVEWIKAFAAFLGAYLVVIGPATVLYLRSEFDRKGTAHEQVAAHRTEVHSIVARLELDRTLRRESVDQRLSDITIRFRKLEEDRDHLMRDNISRLSDIETTLGRIDERLLHIERAMKRGHSHE